MTREDARAILKNCLDKAEYKHGAYGIALEMAIKALEQEPCDEYEELDFIQEHKKTPVTLDLTPCDEYGNYRYPSDIELPEPNTATSIPCDDAISRQAVIDEIDFTNRSGGFGCKLSYTRCRVHIEQLPSVNPQEPKTETWSIKDVTNTFKKYGLIKEQESDLDKIRAEIVHFHDWAFSREEILRLIDKYISESESGDDNKG